MKFGRLVEAGPSVHTLFIILMLHCMTPVYLSLSIERGYTLDIANTQQQERINGAPGIFIERA